MGWRAERGVEGTGGDGLVMVGDVDIARSDATRTHTLEVARWLADEGFIVDLVTRGFDPDIRGVRFSRAGASNVSVLRRAFSLNARAISILVRRRHSARALYLRHDWTLAPTCLAGRVLGYRVVAQVDGICFGPSHRLLREPGVRGWFADHFRHWTTVFMTRLASNIVAVTKELRTLLVRDYGADPERVRVLPNGADTELFSPLDRSSAIRRAGLDPEWQYVVFVGLFEAWADFDTMLQAFAQVARSSSRAHLLLVGDGPRRTEVERLVAELAIQKRVTLTGFIRERARVRDFVCAASVCLVAHRAEHVAQIGVSPTKLAEYFAAGRPVVAVGLPGVRSMIERSGGGIAVPADPAAMAAAIESLLDDPKNAELIGAAGRRAAEEQYSWQSIVKRTVPLLRDAS